MSEQELEQLEHKLERGSLPEQRQVVLQLLQKMKPEDLEKSGRSHWVYIFERLNNLNPVTPAAVDNVSESMANAAPELDAKSLQKENDLLLDRAVALKNEMYKTLAKVFCVQFRINDDKVQKALTESFVNGKDLGAGNIDENEFNELRLKLRPYISPPYPYNPEESIGKATSQAAQLMPTRFQLEIEQRLMYVLALLPRVAWQDLIGSTFNEVLDTFRDRVGLRLRDGQEQIISRMLILDFTRKIVEKRHGVKVAPSSLLELFRMASGPELNYAYKPLQARGRTAKNTPLSMEPAPKK